MEIISYYEVTYNTDSVEGKGFTKGTGIAFKDEGQAIEFVRSDHYKKHAVMGVIPGNSYSKYHVRLVNVQVYDTLQDYSDNKDESERQIALQKIRTRLTDKELEVLGIK